MNAFESVASELLPTVLMLAWREKESRETFVTRLHKMIGSSPDDVVAWSDDGSQFAIKDVQAFQKVLTQEFRLSSMSSFVRQLNEYGFRKLRSKGRTARGSASSASASASSSDASTTAAGADKAQHYTHERFLRDAPLGLLGTIQRRQAYSGKRRNLTYADEAACEVTEERVARLEDGIDGVCADMQKVNEMLVALQHVVQSLPKPGQAPCQARAPAALVQEQAVEHIAYDARDKRQLSLSSGTFNGGQEKRAKANELNQPEAQRQQEKQQQPRRRQQAMDLSSDLEAFMHGIEEGNSFSGLSDLSLSSSTAAMIEELTCRMSSSLTISAGLRQSSSDLQNGVVAVTAVVN